MASSFGPLVEPGWPNLQGGPDLAKNFIAGAALGANINAKARALENQLAMYALKAQKMEHDRELDYAKFGLAQEKLALQADRNAALTDVAYANLKLKDETTGLAVQKYNDLVEGKSGLVEAQAQLESEGLHPGDKNYIQRFNELTAPIIGKVPTSTLNAVQRTVYNNHNSASKEKYKYLDSEYRHLVADAGATLYGNANPVNPDLTPIIHPEALPFKKTGGGWFGGPEKVDQSKKLVPSTDAQGNKVEDREVSVSDLNRLNKRWKQWEALRQELAPTVNRPDLGVYGGSETKVTIKDSKGGQWTIPADKLEQAKQRDPGLVIVP